MCVCVGWGEGGGGGLLVAAYSHVCYSLESCQIEYALVFDRLGQPLNTSRRLFF